MTPAEFKSWFEGFTESMDKVPTQKAWARVKERVAEIDGKPVTQQVLVDRYWPPAYAPYWRSVPLGQILCGNATTTNTAANSLASGALASVGAVHNAAQTGQLGASVYNSGDAMNLLGKADYDALKAA